MISCYAVPVSEVIKVTPFFEDLLQMSLEDPKVGGASFATFCSLCVGHTLPVVLQ
jgi:hypothetical protein